jgi:hypothetical protein
LKTRCESWWKSRRNRTASKLNRLTMCDLIYEQRKIQQTVGLAPL